MRPMCLHCKQRPRAVAYHKYNRIYYRSQCTSCIRKSHKEKPQIPKWQSDGYKKKTTCDRCGFRSKYAAQLLVFHVDGNLNNSGLRNLKTICLNCIEEVKRADLPWRSGDLEPDL